MGLDGQPHPSLLSVGHGITQQISTVPGCDVSLQPAGSCSQLKIEIILNRSDLHGFLPPHELERSRKQLSGITCPSATSSAKVLQSGEPHWPHSFPGSLQRRDSIRSCLAMASAMDRRFSSFAVQISLVSLKSTPS